ncbi:hypothetical protein FH972_022593 [Carpinus fangiana]|uniref:Uncharacterized protein n=1 Tax=Carpinus fangiana TaxID=176857 RepID=A0A5N6KT35_9ROSI|nr:hypothetical protein FH972_022593 [Carpinus fangiana]
MPARNNPREVADPEVEADVHLLILDYLAYRATQAVLDDLDKDESESGHEPQASTVEQHIALFNGVDSRNARPPHPLCPSVSRSVTLRVKLLQFVITYNAYLHPEFAENKFSEESMIALRIESGKRAEFWWRYHKLEPEGAKEEAELERKAYHSMDSMKHVHPDQSQWASRPGLLDLVPEFIQLTATRMHLHGEGDNADEEDDQAQWGVSEGWLRLAADMMLQSCRDSPANIVRTIHPALEAFSWGPLPLRLSGQTNQTDRMDIDEHVSSDLFRSQLDGNGDDFSQDRLWRKDGEDPANLNSIFNIPSGPEATSSSPETWNALRADHINRIPDDIRNSEPSHAFHPALMGFLRSLMTSIAPPLLSQLERDNSEHIWLEELDLTTEESARLRDVAKALPNPHPLLTRRHPGARRTALPPNLPQTSALPAPSPHNPVFSTQRRRPRCTARKEPHREAVGASPGCEDGAAVRVEGRADGEACVRELRGGGEGAVWRDERAGEGLRRARTDRGRGISRRRGRGSVSDGAGGRGVQGDGVARGAADCLDNVPLAAARPGLRGVEQPQGGPGLAAGGDVGDVGDEQGAGAVGLCGEEADGGGGGGVDADEACFGGGGGVDVGYCPVSWVGDGLEGPGGRRGKGVRGGGVIVEEGVAVSWSVAVDTAGLCKRRGEREPQRSNNCCVESRREFAWPGGQRASSAMAWKLRGSWLDMDNVQKTIHENSNELRTMAIVMQ